MNEQAKAIMAKLSNLTDSFEKNLHEQLERQQTLDSIKVRMNNRELILQKQVNHATDTDGKPQYSNQGKRDIALFELKLADDDYSADYKLYNASMDLMLVIKSHLELSKFQQRNILAMADLVSAHIRNSLLVKLEEIK